MRFKRMAAAFDEVSKARLRESSGSEHSLTESVTDLYGLVNSFLEREDDEDINIDDDYCGVKLEENGTINCFNDLEIKDKLSKLLGYEESDDDVKRNIHGVVANAWLEVGDRSTKDFKRLLMTRLRDRGFDAGLCKSKWERNGQLPSGKYEYIDIIVDNKRYIIEVHLAREFQIARATTCYTLLLEIFPSIFVGKVEDLKQVVRLMSRAMKKSMKKMDIYVPPWRKLGYIHAKWFGSYKRTISELLDDHQRTSYNGNLAKKRAIGFVSKTTISFYCRENFASNINGIKMGNLAAALNG